jgi:hypothetical protein
MAQSRVSRSTPLLWHATTKASPPSAAATFVVPFSMLDQGPAASLQRYYSWQHLLKFKNETTSRVFCTSLLSK